MKFKALVMSFVWMLLLTGCTTTPGDANTPLPTSLGQTENPTEAVPTETSTAAAVATANPTVTATATPKATATAKPAAASHVMNYSQYLKKTWIRNTDSNFPVGLSFIISNIKDGKIHGKLSMVGNAPAYNQDTAEFEGTVNNDIAEGQLVNDSRGNKGTLKLVFKPDNTLEATIALTGKSSDPVMTLPEGTFEFVPYNLKNIDGFELIENQTFMADLNSWGNVKFVSGKLTAGNHIPVVFYLTNEVGDILYNFNAALPYSVDVQAVSFEDVNRDGLKDVIIIVADNYDGASGGPIAAVYLQNADGSFTNDYKLDQEINDSGNNKDIGAITNYLASKF